MKQRNIELPEELKYVNRLKWGYESPDESPKRVYFRQHGDKRPREVEVYNFFGYSFTEN
ncbi:hypothetical protein I2I11_08415 [Pontibacter sp. 172403-2]|uniref:hypothetical protein n=1 Tax=Pontibacter rufus TaxID=2791028 RepID=UPI0018B005F2|nr:hypothetical protein [Pontibacter sp. 172403-2]MBF9253312.1 hypothetical protein [Pontibacter sp. 172403-2]